MNAADLPLVAPVPQWHELLHIPRDWMYSATASGELRCLRKGRSILIPRSAILEWLGEPVDDSVERGRVTPIRKAAR